jgi:hypothetical protein
VKVGVCSQEDVDRIVSEFNSSEKPLTAVYNGRLSEGIDLSANTVLLIGIPFSPPTTRTAKLLRRLTEIIRLRGQGEAVRCHTARPMVSPPSRWKGYQGPRRQCNSIPDRQQVQKTTTSIP